MKTRSFVGPLILIVIGVVFLIHSLKPETNVVEILARFWPLVLMAWGALRMLEILILAVRGRPLPASGVSGGEWALVILLCIVGSGTYFVYEKVNWQPLRIRMKGVELFGEPYDFTVKSQTIPTGAAPRLVIENLRGNVRIKGADTTAVEIAGRKTVRALDSASATETDRLTPLEWEQQGTGYIIRTNHTRARGEEFVSTDLEITVPRAARIEARGRRGDWDIAAVQGAIELVSDNAGVRIDDVAGPVKIDTRASDVIRLSGVRGNVDLQGFGQDLELERIDGQVVINGTYFGEVQFRELRSAIRYDGNRTEMRAEALPGQFRMNRGDLLLDGVVGPVLIETQSKDVQVSGYSQQLTVRLDRGDVELRPGTGAVPPTNVVLRAGDIELAMPEKARFKLQATARQGEIENDYDEEAIRVTEDGDDKQGRTTAVSVAPAGPEVSLLTERGTIRLRVLDPAEVHRNILPPRQPAPPPPPPPMSAQPEPQRLNL
jgi:hypothetical protein